MMKRMVSTEGSNELDVWLYLQTFTNDAISRIVFGSNYEEGRRVFQLLREQAEHTIQAITSVYIPGWSRVFGTRITPIRLIDCQHKAY
ncbi:hypothetical protein U1Q18_015152 [Sarracenia purpurea var. burkii]